MRLIDEFPPYCAKRNDWTQILDGHIRELEPGIDFNCQPSSMVRTVKAAARRHGVAVDVRCYVRREDQRKVVAVRAKPLG